MQHIRPTGKGDPLCPLGFHPQVRWPTRCKRCFRDYKEHGNRNKEVESLRRDDTTASSPALSSWSSRSREDSKNDSGTGTRSWTSSSNLSNSVSNLSSSSSKLSDASSNTNSATTGFSKAASSWTSTPNLTNLKDDSQLVTTVNLTLPRRRPKPVDTGQDDDDYRRTQYTVRRRTSTSLSSDSSPSSSSSSSSSWTPRSTVTASATITPAYSSRASRTPERRTPEVTPPPSTASKPPEKTSKADLDFMIQVKSTKPPKAPTKKTTKKQEPSTAAASSSSSEDDDDDDSSVAATDTTEATLVNETSEMQEQIDSLKQELETMKARCEKAEREKSDIMLRRIASLDTASTKTAASENLKLQQKLNELKTTVEDLRDDKRSLSLRVKELEADMEKLKTVQEVEKEAETLRAKLQAAETLCEELMDENEDMKRELRDLEEEMDEMQDNFREEQADEYTSLKKELEQTAKNCRILSFKLRKAERKMESVEAEKQEVEKKCLEMAGGKAGLDKAERIRTLEQELAVANEVAQRLQKELEETKQKAKCASEKNEKSATKKKAPMLGSIGKISSGERVSRESLTRGGSQEDPVQLLRDLQDSMEREADLREQLRYAEEEAENLRKKASRVEDDNDSLVLQLKKMATKARTVRRHSPSASRLTPEPPQEKDEGISDEDDPAELRLLLELNEQEAAVLRRKVEELEGEGNSLKRKVKELQEKLTAKSDNRSTLQKQTSETGKTNPIYEQKIKVFEEEMNDLRKKLLVKERDCERLHAEISLSQKKPKTLQKSKSLDASSEALDLKRQLQVVEQEASVLRTRNQNLESDNEKLVAENKRMMLTRGTKKTSASDSSALIELKEKVNTLEKQLEEANKKVEKYESDKGKNSTPVKKDGKEVSLAEFDKLKSQLMKVESEKVKLKDSLIRLKEEAMADIATFYHKRTPKKPTDLTTKLQLKKMVDDLESEIGEVLVALRKSEKERKESIKTPKEDITSTKLKSEIEELNKKLEETQKELKQEKNKADKELDKLQKEIKRLEEDKRKEENEKEKLKKQFDEEKKKSLSEKETVNKLKAEIESCKAAKEEGTRLKKEIEKLNNEIKEEQKKCSEVQKQLEIAQKTDQDRSKLIKDIGDKTKKLNEAEKKTKELEEKLKKSDRLVGSKKEKITKLEKEVEEYKTKLESLQSNQKTDLESWQSDKAALLEKISDLEAETAQISSELADKKSVILQLESNIKHERDKASDLTVKVGSAASRDIAQLKEELTSAKSSIQQFKDKLDKSEEEKKSLEKSLKESESKIEKEIAEWENKASELEMDLQAERKLIERLKASHDKEINTKDAEIVALKAKASQTVGKKLTEMKQEMQAKIDKLELALESEKHEYDELTSKYELLEEEHVVTKAQFVREREDIQGQLVTTQTELVGIETELRTLRDTYNNKQDDWIKEKLEFQNKLQELEEKADQETWVLEKIRLNAICEEKASEIDTLRRENMTQVEQIECMRKENDELRRKLEDYDKVVKVQRSYSSDTSNIERELRETKNKLYMEEKARKTELSAMKLSYDNRVSVITSELKSSQAQVSRFKRERDTFRHMLEAAQKNIAELKAAGPRTPSSGTASPEESEELHSQIATLEQQISCMEDELSESRLEASRLKTELVSERSAWEVKLSELNSKINELEEDRLLSTGRTKISGLKTRMELAWHKEREEQQRLLQEASTLARDLRQTLFEVERERDKERLEAKRKLEQMKKTVEEEQEENRKKLNEMQCDLLELRDAHAKLRTTNEKLRREKERSEKERDLMKQASVTKRRNDQDDERKVAALVRLVDELMTDAPELFPSKTAPTSLTVPTPPVRRKGPKSRESSPAIEREPSEEPKSTNLQNTLKRLSEAVEELRRDQRRSEDRERLGQARKSFSNRRAASTESENPPEAFGVGNGNKGLQRKGSLFRKSLSLEQTSATSHEMGIWKTEDETEGSLTSIQSLDEAYEAKFMRRDPSLDSRLSGGSTQSEVITSSTEKKKKKGLFGKLKKLTKSSRSIDQDGSDYGGGSASQLDQGSDTSLSTVPDAEHISKRDLKDRLTGIFKKSGSTSRGNSLERNAKPPVSGGNEQRPLSRVSSSNTLPRASPARSDASQTSSSTARPLGGVSPGSVPLQRKVKPK
ncbi:uncharacterized protein LOC142319510 isoform X4 [Lycorma delicatula]|uniref:uncharacterized protein LOC142319510 isoform X4 n=1 Tax=Lycorma delicatula TaxID=130591 RepID=UPI003F514265